MLVHEMVDYAVFLVDPDGCIASWNEGVARNLGYDEGEFIGLPFRSIFNAEDQAQGADQQELDRARQEGRSDDQRWHVRKDGSQFWCDGVLNALRSETGELLGYSKILRDATARKKAEEELKESRERLEAALSAAHTGTYRWDLATDVLVWDNRLNELFGLMPGQAVQRLEDLFARIHPDDVPAVRESYERCRREGVDFHCEYRVPLASGGMRWVYDRGTLFRAGNGAYMTGAATDTTAHKQAEQERERLLQENARILAEMKAIFASIPDAIYVGDENGIRECNARALEMLGFDTGADLDRSVAVLAREIQTRDARTGQVLTAEMQPFTRALKGEAVTAEVSTRRVDTNEEVIVRCAAAPVRLDGEVIAAVAINTDITAQKAAERRQEQLLAALRRSNEQLTQFAYVVSHDLQAPLRSIRSFTQLLDRRYKGQLDTAADEFIASIVDGATRMEQLIRALLQYAQAGDRNAPRAPVRLAGILDGVLMNLHDILRETGGTVIAESELPTVQGDWFQLLQLFQNLVANALKYRRPGVPPQVRVSAERRAGTWRIAVADNGIGIAPADFEQIFEPLKRLHGREIPGTGIGLSICKKIVDSLGGRLWVESEPGSGATFFFTLPD